MIGAKCAGRTELMFSARLAEARALCRACPLAVGCLTAALEAERRTPDLRFGMFGGATPAQRAALEVDGAAAFVALLRAPTPPPPVARRSVRCAWCRRRFAQRRVQGARRRVTCSQRCRDARSRARHLEERRTADLARFHAADSPERRARRAADARARRARVRTLTTPLAAAS